MENLLIVLPLFFAPLLIKLEQKVRDVLSIVFILILSSLSVVHFFSFTHSLDIDISDVFHSIFTFLDIVLLFYFLMQGYLFKHKFVLLLSSLQILLYRYILTLDFSIASSDIIVDSLSTLFYLIINIVGGVIILFALKYIESEEFTRVKKNSFIAILFFFLAVMNFIVSTNSIETFFMLFELTTLSSYVLIGYRADEVSKQNALRALWVNQIGGVAILLALVLSIKEYDTIYFDILIANIENSYLLPIAFLVLAGFVKGASIPFEKWLLGAMVAPTPVSAILHSATMVKIAPFLMLKLAPAMDSFLSLTITLFGTFVFVTASFLALSKDYFKEILGLSTIALLALMMALASIGTEEATLACLILITFHAISKALLFLQAGILEKNFHLKYVQDIDGLINHSPLVVFFILIGFASLTLPPFGAFIAKMMALESLTALIKLNPLYAIALVFIALGSVFLTLLYFKIVTKLFAKDSDAEVEKRDISLFYKVPSYLLVMMLFIGIYVSFQNNFLTNFEIFISTALLLLIPIFLEFFLFKKADRVKEYCCGEKDELEVSMYYFDLSDGLKRWIRVLSYIFIATLFIGVLL